MVSVCRVLRLLLSRRSMLTFNSNHSMYPPARSYTRVILLIYVRFYRCKCGRCNSQYLQNPNKFQCCAEIAECVECQSHEMVIEEVGKKPDCVTLHPGFSQVCLQRWSLRLAADKYKTKNKTKYRQTGSENR